MRVIREERGLKKKKRERDKDVYALLRVDVDVDVGRRSGVKIALGC